MSNHFWVVGCIVLLGCQASVHAEEVKRAKAGLSLTLPDGWKVAENKETLGLTTSDKDFAVVGIELADLDKDELKQIKESPAKLIETLKLFKKVKASEDEPEEVKKNKLRQTRWLGTGKTENKEVEWHLTLVEGAKHPFVVIGIGKVEDNQDELNELLDSIKKAGSDE